MDELGHPLAVVDVDAVVAKAPRCHMMTPKPRYGPLGATGPGGVPAVVDRSVLVQGMRRMGGWEELGPEDPLLADRGQQDLAPRALVLDRSVVLQHCRDGCGHRILGAEGQQQARPSKATRGRSGEALCIELTWQATLSRRATRGARVEDRSTSHRRIT